MYDGINSSDIERFLREFFEFYKLDYEESFKEAIDNGTIIIV